MAMQALRGKFIYAPHSADFLAGGTVLTVQINAAGEGLALGFRAQGSTVDKAAFRVEGVVTPGDLDVSIQTLATTGLPDGTPIGSTINVNVSGAGVVEVTGLNATGLGDADYCLVIVGESGFAGDLTVRTSEGAPAVIANTPYISVNVTGSFVKNTSTAVGAGFAFAVGDGTGYWNIPGWLGPYDLVTTSAITSSSTPRELGNLFNLPFAATLWGVAFRTAYAGAAADGAFTVYSTPAGTPTSMTSATLDDDTVVSTATRVQLMKFDDEVDWSINTDYVIGVTSTGANGITTMRLDYGNNAQLDALLSKNITAVDRATTGATSFTPDTDSCHCIWPIFSKLSDNVSAGGGTTIAGTTLLRGLAH